MIEILTICPVEEEMPAKEHLTSLGVVVGIWTGESFERCEVTPDALEKLQPFWMGKYIWSRATV